MSILDYQPYHDGVYKAFGFFTSEEAGIELIRACLHTGERTKDGLRKLYQNQKDNRKLAIFKNALNYLGYIPGVGVFTGLFKIYLGTFQKRNPNKTRRIVKEKEVDNAHLVRGIVEIIGLGIIFITADVFVTFGRRQNPISLEDLIELAND